MSDHPVTADEMYGDWRLTHEQRNEALERSRSPRSSDSLFDTFATLGVGAGDLVLDIGARDARHSLQLAARFGCRVVAVDPVADNVREALGEPGAYSSAGIDTAIDLLFARSTRLERPPLAAHVAGRVRHFGAAGDPVGELRTDIETFVRLTGGRRPDRERYRMVGARPADVVLFT